MKRIYILVLILFGSSCFLFGKELHPARRGKDFALFFAIDNYQHWDTLRNPIKDARAIANDLSRYYGFKTEVIVNPTKTQIYDKLKEYRDNYRYDDDAQLFIFFSGHGYYNKKLNQGFFIPSEGQKGDSEGVSYIAHQDLRKRIAAIKCRHILVAMDACYSGSFGEDIPKNKGDIEPYGRPGEMEFQYKQYIKEKLRYQCRIFLTSGGKERTSDGITHSPFAYAFLKALRSSKATNKVLTTNELYYAYMDDIDVRPRPQIGGFEGHEPGGEFVFVFEPPTGEFIPPPLPKQPKRIIIPRHIAKGTYLYPALTVGAGAVLFGSSYVFKSNADYYYQNYRETFPAANSDDIYAKANRNNKMFLIGKYGGIGLISIGAVWLTTNLIRSRNTNLSYQPILDTQGNAAFSFTYRF